MTTFKKRIAILLSVLMIASLFAVGTVSASAEDEIGAGWFVVGDAPMFGASWAPAAAGALTETGGIYNVTYENVPAGTYHFKVVETNSKGSIKTWHPDGMGNDSEVVVEEAGSTVRFCLVPTGNPSADEAYAEVFAPGQDVAPLTPAETEPETEPETTAPPVLPDGVLNVTVNSNVGKSSTAAYNSKSNSSFTIDFKVKASDKITSAQGYFTYDSTLLRLDSFTLSDKLHNAVINTENYNKVTFNATDVNSSADFSSTDVFASVKFTMLGIGSTTVAFNVTELTSVTEDNSFVSLVTDSAPDSSKVSGATTLSTPVEPATEKPATPKVTVSPTKKTVKAGQTFSIKVKNNKKKATYSSNKKTVATVTTAGKVTALKKGTATITVKADGKKYSCKVTVSNNPTAKIKKKTVSTKKTYTIKKGKTISVALTGRASAIGNTYKTSKKSIAKVISKAKVNTVKIKGYKLGKATITIKVNKVKSFKIKVKVVKK